jgi:MSHA biogenesis protein MshN
VSLINKMLQDLEARAPSSSRAGDPAYLFKDLRATRSHSRRANALRLAILLVAVLLFVAVAYWPTLSEWLFEPAAAPAPLAAPVAVPPMTAPAPLPAEPAPVTAEAPPAPPKPVAPAVRVPPKAPVANAPPRPVSPPAKQPTPIVAESSETVAAASIEKKLKPLSAAEQAETAYREAATAMQQGRASDAEARLRAALTAQPGHTKARELLAGILLQTGRGAEARQTLQQGLAAAPASPALAQLLARLYVQDGQDAAALALLESARASATKDADYLALLAAVYQRSARHADAIKAYGDALSLRPREGRWWLGLGVSQEAVNDFTAAADAYQKAITTGTLDPKLLAYAQQRQSVLKSQ